MASRGHGYYKVGRNVVNGLAFAIVVGLILGLFIQFLWNETIAETFRLNAISFWQAVGLFILAKLFFGFGSGGGRREFKFRTKLGDSSDSDQETDDVPDDDAFRLYWREEGKAAYDEYRSQGDQDTRE